VAAPKLNHAAIDRTIRRHWSKLRKKGVLAVRPGYAFTGGWITNQPAAVAIVDKKKKHVPPKDLLPTRIGDTAVDVQEAGPIERFAPYPSAGLRQDRARPSRVQCSCRSLRAHDEQDGRAAGPRSAACESAKVRLELAEEDAYEVYSPDPGALARRSDPQVDDHLPREPRRRVARIAAVPQ